MMSQEWHLTLTPMSPGIWLMMKTKLMYGSPLERTPHQLGTSPSCEHRHPLLRSPSNFGSNSLQIRQDEAVRLELFRRERDQLVVEMPTQLGDNFVERIEMSSGGVGGRGLIGAAHLARSEVLLEFLERAEECFMLGVRRRQSCSDILADRSPPERGLSSCLRATWDIVPPKQAGSSPLQHRRYVDLRSPRTRPIHAHLRHDDGVRESRVR